jgi:hypothetical protein
MEYETLFVSCMTPETHGAHIYIAAALLKMLIDWLQVARRARLQYIRQHAED